MNESTGSRKRFMTISFWVAISSILSAVVLQLITYAIHVTVLNEAGWAVKDIVSSPLLTALVTIFLVATGAYTGARALPGSVEYTPPDQRPFDPTVNQGPPPWDKKEQTK
jgi:hypothetical protein